MTDSLNKLNRPIRVIVFSGGPVLERGVKQFLCRLDDHPEIDLLDCFCQSADQSFKAVMRDLWRRRRLLSVPLLGIRIAGKAWRFLAHPRQHRSLDKKISELSNRIHYVPDIHAETVLECVREQNPDLGLIYGSPILRPELFEIPKFGTLGIHHGKVPKYRGKKTTFWAVYYGEETAGVTIQKVNAGLDTGEIVKEGNVPIGSRSLRAVWNNLNKLGLDLYIQAILDIKHGKAHYQPQEGKKGRLYSDPRIKDILTLWWRQLNRMSIGIYSRIISF